MRLHVLERDDVRLLREQRGDFDQHLHADAERYDRKCREGRVDLRYRPRVEHVIAQEGVCAQIEVESGPNPIVRLLDDL